MTSETVTVPFPSWRQCSTYSCDIIDRKGNLVAKVADETNSGEPIKDAARNATLIANAPSLAEACMTACDLLDSFDFKLAKEALEYAVRRALPSAFAPAG